MSRGIISSRMSTTNRMRSASFIAVIDLAIDVLAQIVAVDHADSAGIEKLDKTGIGILSELNERTDPVPRDAGHRVDNGDPSTGKAS